MRSASYSRGWFNLGCAKVTVWRYQGEVGVFVEGLALHASHMRCGASSSPQRGAGFALHASRSHTLLTIAMEQHWHFGTAQNLIGNAAEQEPS